MKPNGQITDTKPGEEFKLAFLLRTFGRGWRKVCPACGEAKMFTSYFTMRPVCPHCGVVYERENGEYMASMYLSIIITEFLFVICYIFMNYILETSMWVTLAFLLPLNGLFPVWFYPKSKSLWAAALHVMGGLYKD